MLNIIFDIDGTLLHTGGGGKQAFLKAFEKVHNINNTHDPVFKGGIDFAVYNEMLKLYGLDFNLKLWNIFKLEYSKLLDLNYRKNKINWIIFQDVFKILEFFKFCKVNLYIVTGNIQEGAFIKLKNTGLLKYFNKIFACEFEKKRVDIIKKCIDFVGFDRSIYIGDSDKDESAAKLLDLPFIKITHNVETHYKNGKPYFENSSFIEKKLNNNFFNFENCDKLDRLYNYLKESKIVYLPTVKDLYNYIINFN